MHGVQIRRRPLPERGPPARASVQPRKRARRSVQLQPKRAAGGRCPRPRPPQALPAEKAWAATGVTFTLDDSTELIGTGTGETAKALWDGTIAPDTDGDLAIVISDATLNPVNWIPSGVQKSDLGFYIPLKITGAEPKATVEANGVTAQLDDEGNGTVIIPVNSGQFGAAMIIKVAGSDYALAMGDNGIGYTKSMDMLEGFKVEPASAVYDESGAYGDDSHPFTVTATDKALGDTVSTTDAFTPGKAKATDAGKYDVDVQFDGYMKDAYDWCTLEDAFEITPANLGDIDFAWIGNGEFEAGKDTVANVTNALGIRDASGAVDGSEVETNVSGNIWKVSVDSSTHTATISVGTQLNSNGVSNYTGTKTLQYTVKNAGAIELTKDNIDATPATEAVYDFGNEVKPGFDVVYDKDGVNTELVEGADYTVAYENNTEAGEATAVITGTGSYTGTVEVEFEIDKRDIKDAKVTVSGERSYTDKTRRSPSTTSRSRSTAMPSRRPKTS